MSKLFLLIVFIAAIGVFGFWLWMQKGQGVPNFSSTKKRLQVSNNMIPLPEPKLKSQVSLEEAIFKRRSQREFQDKPLTLEQLSQILWAAQGVTDVRSGFRAAPSAGALYPLEIYVVVGENGVGELDASVYHYIPDGHRLELHLEKDIKDELFAAALSQGAVLQSPVSLVIAAGYERTTGKYGERGVRYVWLEAGHVAQNVYLEATVLGLGTVTIGAFDDERIIKVLQLPLEHQPLYIMPIGYPNSF